MTTQFIFFPFTHITRRQLATISTFVDVFHYFNADTGKRIDPGLKCLVDEKKVVVHCVSEDLAIRVSQTQAQYLDWVKIHQGNEHNLKALIKDNPYFKDDTQVASIKSQLRDATQVASIKSQIETGNCVKSEKAVDEKTLEQHLLFLKMAHLCDSQNDSIDIELNKLDENKDKLLSALRGLEGAKESGDVGDLDEEIKKSESVFKIDLGATDFGAVMTRERIESWSACMTKLDCYLPNERPVFVTTSQAVFEYLESICEDCLNALDIDEIKVHHNECENKKEWQQHFYKNLKSAVQGDDFLEDRLPTVDDTCSLVGQIKVNLFSGNEINKCFHLSDKQVMVCLMKLK